MFDIGFWELAVIGVIALLVVGPERLPAVARSVGLWVGRIRRYVSHVKQDIERELHADEVRQLIEKPEELDALRDVAKETASVFEDARSTLKDTGRVRQGPGDASPATQPPAGATPESPPAPSGATQAPPDPAPREAPAPEDEQQPERQGQR